MPPTTPNWKVILLCRQIQYRAQDRTENAIPIATSTTVTRSVVIAILIAPLETLLVIVLVLIPAVSVLARTSITVPASAIGSALIVSVLIAPVYGIACRFGTDVSIVGIITVGRVISVIRVVAIIGVIPINAVITVNLTIACPPVAPAYTATVVVDRSGALSFYVFTLSSLLCPLALSVVPRTSAPLIIATLTFGFALGALPFTIFFSGILCVSEARTADQSR